jgi:hypothetical protein
VVIHLHKDIDARHVVRAVFPEFDNRILEREKQLRVSHGLFSHGFSTAILEISERRKFRAEVNSARPDFPLSPPGFRQTQRSIG